MDFEEKLLPFLKEHMSALVLGGIGLLFLGYGLINLSMSQTSDTAPFVPTQAASPIKSSLSLISKKITIDIEGAVMKPGVYTLPQNSRIQDALIASGGLSQNADRKKVAQTLNFAAPLTDGAKIYIPAVGEQMTAVDGTSGSTSGGGSSSQSPLNINQASESELDALPGVGPVTAQKIIDNRPYQNVQELLDKKVVGASAFGKIKDMVSVY